MATCTLAISTNSSSNTNSYATGSFTPAANDLLVVFVHASATTVQGTVTNSAGLSFTYIGQAVKATSADRIAVFVATSLAAASSQTCTYDCTGDNATNCTVSVMRVSGMSRTGSSAVRQNTSNNNITSANIEATFASACDTSNPTFGAVYWGGATTVPAPTSWTNVVDNTTSAPADQVELCYRNSGFTGTLVDWAKIIGTGQAGAIIVEMDTSSPPAASPSAFFQLF